jgi:tagaturonate epimerase
LGWATGSYIRPQTDRAQTPAELLIVPASAAHNRSFRPLMNVSLKIAAKMGGRYLDLLRQNEAVIAKIVTENLYERHVVPVFLGGQT